MTNDSKGPAQFNTNTGADGLPVRLPEVDVKPIEETLQFFIAARQMAVDPAKRRIIVVTPGRMFMQVPCPPPGSMPPEAIQGIQQLIPMKPPINVTVIANNDLSYLSQGAAGTARIIPFLGYVLGMGYIGHNVVVFEGHPSALAAGCANAHLLILDEAMIPFLQPDWLQVALEAMSTQLIMIFKRDGKLSFYREGKFT